MCSRNKFLKWLYGHLVYLLTWEISEILLTAVKSAPKNPCSRPDQIVNGISKSCFFRLICLPVAIINSQQPAFFSSLSLTSPNLKKEMCTFQGGGMCSRLGAQFIIKAKILGVQNHHFIYYQPKYWVRKCAPLRIRFRRPWWRSYSLARLGF